MQEATPLPQSPDDNGDEINLLDLLIGLGEEKWIIIGVTVLAAVAAVLFALTMPRMYTAKTLVMPPQQQSSASSALAGLGALAGVVNAVGAARTPEELYMRLFTTESLQDSLIEKFKLKDRYGKTRLLDARATLTRSVKIESERKSGLITLEADDADPVFAAKLANAHVDELRKLLSRLAVSDAQQRRAFFEQQISKTKDALNAAELRFRQAKENSGVQVSEGMVTESVARSATLRTRIAALEVQLQVMRTYATSENSDVQRLTDELSATRSQLSRIEQGGGAARAATLAGNAAVEAFREVKLQEAVLVAYIRQLELARADEAREGPLIQQIDIALVPERASKPNRRLYVQSATLVGLLLGLVIAVARVTIRRILGNPESSGKLAAARRAWSLWPSRDRRPVR